MPKKGKKPQKKKEVFGMEKPIIFPSGIAIGDTEAGDVKVVTFYSSPPEKPEITHILFRVVLTPVQTAYLVKAFSPTEKKKKKPSKKSK